MGQRRETSESLDEAAQRHVNWYNSGGKFLDVGIKTTILGLISPGMAGAYLGSKVGTLFPDRYVETHSEFRQPNFWSEVDDDGNVKFRTSPKRPLIKRNIDPVAGTMGGVTAGLAGAFAGNWVNEKLFEKFNIESDGAILTPWAEAGLNYIQNLF